MRSLFIIFIFLLVLQGIAHAQTDSAFSNVFYAGLRGGYLVKNNALNKNPFYHLGNGMYTEVNGGWRNKMFGWEFAAGMLTIKRDASKFKIYQPSVSDVLNAQTNTAMYNNARDSGQTGNAVFRFPENTQQEQISEDFKGFYALTGPVVWLDKKKLQLNVSVKGGVISRKFGYYLLYGKGISPDSITLSYNSTSATSKPATIGKATVTPNGSYAQYAMTQSAFDAIDRQPSKASPFSINEKAALQLIARASLNAEYFLSHNISVHAGADYWFMPSPKMTGMDSLSGLVNANLRPNATPGTVTKANYALRLTRSYNEEKSLGFLSASVGIKFWPGRKKGAIRRQVLFGEARNEQEYINKNLAIMVAGRTDEKPVKDVTIKIYKEGETDYTETITEENGYAPVLQSLSPGTYTITGIKEGSSTNEVTITPEDFKPGNKVITIKLVLD